MPNIYAQYGTTSEAYPAPVAGKKRRRKSDDTGWENVGPEDELATTSVPGYMASADKSKLNGVEASATADQTDAEVKTAYEANADTNALTDALQTKLNGVEASADVTDDVNVRAALAAATADVAVNSKKITGLAAPVASNDASTKAYVDAAIEGLDHKDSVRVASTANLTLSGEQTHRRCPDQR